MGEAKKASRRAERRFRKSGLGVLKQLFRQACNKCSEGVRKAKTGHVQGELDGASSDPPKMFSVVNKLLGKDASPPIFPDLEDRTAADLLTTIFKEKISAIREGLTDSEESYASDPFVFRGEVLSHFIPETEEQLRNVISRSKLTSARADPIPTKMVINCLDNFIPVSLMGP